MASKWSKLKGEYPVKEDSENRIKIDAVKTGLQPKTDFQLAELYLNLRNEKDAIAQREKDLNVLIEGITEIIVERWASEDDEGEQVSSKTFDGVGKLSVMIEPYSQFLNIQALKPYLQKAGMSHLVQETVQWQSGNSWIKALLEEGMALPPVDVVKVFLKNKLRLVKEK